MIDKQAGHPGNSGWTVEHGINGDARVKDAEGVEVGRVLRGEGRRGEGRWTGWVPGRKGAWDHVCVWDSFHMALQDVFDELWSRVTGIEYTRKPWLKFADDKRKRKKEQRA